MKNFVRKLLIGVAVIFTIGILEIWFVERVSLIDAVFSTLTLFLTGGPGSLDIDTVSPTTKIFSSIIIVTGTLAIAGTVGFVADYMLSTRIQKIMGKKAKKMKDHIILAGLGQTGFRIYEELLYFGDKVTILEGMENEFTGRLQRQGVPVLIGDLGSPEILLDVNIKEAKSLIVATDDDLTNVELAVNAKELRPDINIVLKMFDQRLASKLQAAFDIRAAFSATALAAPAFAAASHCNSVLDSIHLGDHTLVTAEIDVDERSHLLRYNFLKLLKEIEMTVLCYQKRGHKPIMHPKNLCSIHSGDKMTVVCTLPNLEKLQELNEPFKKRKVKKSA
jgi:Trk K+ transport system NAD-binding subunit